MADIVFPGATPPPPVLGLTRLPSNLDLAIWQGDVQQYDIALTKDDGTVLDLTGMTPEAVIRHNRDNPAEYEFTCTVVNNRIYMVLPSSVTKTMEGGSYIWNLQLTDTAGNVRTYLAGDVTVYSEVDA